MKNYKVPGEDEITAELIKAGGDSLYNAIYELILKIWRNERIPEEMGIGIICPIYKKRDRLECDNYRGITLLNTIYKIITGIINKKLTVYSERILWEYQCGFRPGKSTTDHIFVMRQILEKFYEHNAEIHILFVDFKQAFDHVNRQLLCNAIRSMGYMKNL